MREQHVSGIAIRYAVPAGHELNPPLFDSEAGFLDIGGIAGGHVPGGLAPQSASVFQRRAARALHPAPKEQRK